MNSTGDFDEGCFSHQPISRGSYDVDVYRAAPDYKNYYEFVETRTKGTEAFTVRDIKHVMKKILEGVAFLHDDGLIDKELKSGNIVIHINKERFSESFRVGTMWYKAPELLQLGPRDYSSAADMWAVGCIMAELVLSRVLFTGESDTHQLHRIHEVISPSDNHVRLKIASEVAFSGATRLTDKGLDLLYRLMQYDPNKRITAKDAINHAWFTEV